MKKDAKSKKKRIQAAEFFEFPPDVVLHGVNLHIFENAGCVIDVQQGHGSTRRISDTSG